MTDRLEQIRELKISGLTYAQIGEKMGLSRQRIQQILAPQNKRYELLKTEINGVCQGCGGMFDVLDRHHLDYSKDEVVFLCKSCHRKDPSGLDYQKTFTVSFGRFKKPIYEKPDLFKFNTYRKSRVKISRPDERKTPKPVSPSMRLYRENDKQKREIAKSKGWGGINGFFVPKRKFER